MSNTGTRGNNGKRPVWFSVATVLIIIIIFGVRMILLQQGVIEPSTEPVTTTEAVLNEVTAATEAVLSEEATQRNDPTVKEYAFYSKSRLKDHYEKHGIEMGFDSAEEYQAAASAVINNPKALHKLESEDGDDVFYIEETNEFVILSKDGYIRTYFLPSAGKAYFDRQ